MVEVLGHEVNVWVAGIASSGVVAWLGLKVFGWVLPAVLMVQLERIFLRVRSSSWLNSAVRPKRMAAYKAILEMLEAEIPEPESDPLFYKDLGDVAAKHLKGSAKSWAQALEVVGNKLDPELDKEIARLK